MDEPVFLNRRRTLARTVALASSLLILSRGMRRAEAQKSPKAALSYQDQPHDGKKCAECKHFTPGSDASSAGTCAIVDGPIQPNGWCSAFSPR